MLTIQPSLRPNYRNNVTFRAAEQDADSIKYQETKDYYEDQIRAMDSMIDDKNTPGFMKRIAKGFKVIAQGVLEGSAVWVGAKHGGKVLKSSALKFSNSKIAKGMGNVVKPVMSFLRKTGAAVFEFINTNIAKLAKTKFVSTVIEKLNNNKYGKYLVDGAKYVAKGFRYIGDLLSGTATRVSEKVSKLKGPEVYDGAVSVTATTLGTGAGLAGSYDAATRDARAKQAEEALTSQDEEFDDDIERFDDED